MDINIKPKFKIDQEVFCIQTYKEKPVCEICEGLGRVVIKEKEFDCPNCYGTGKQGRYSTILWKLNTEHVISWTIDGIFMTLWKNRKPLFSYGITMRFENGGSCHSTIDENNCFLTLEEALKEIKRRNTDPEIEHDYDD